VNRDQLNVQTTFLLWSSAER